MSSNKKAPVQEIVVHAGEIGLPAFLTLPPDVTGLVVFVHGSGSSCFSSRNRYVAEVLNASRSGHPAI